MTIGRGTVHGDTLVSLIMPVWRPKREWLIQAVESAIGQRGCRIELIVVDDGCAEPVAGLLTGINDERLRILRLEHGGESRARNAGIAASKGSRLRFIDCDDVLDLDSTARLLRLMGRDEDVIAYGVTMVCDSHLRPQYKKFTRLKGTTRIAASPLNGFDVRIPAMLFSRRVVEAAGDWDPTMSVMQDWDFALRALEYARVRGEDKVEFYYRRHAGSSASNGAAAPHIQGALKVVSGYFDRHPEARGTRVETRIQVMLEMLRAGWETGGRPWRSGRFWRILVAHPNAASPVLSVLGGFVRGEMRRVARRTLPLPIYRWLQARRSGQLAPRSRPGDGLPSGRDAQHDESK